MKSSAIYFFSKKLWYSNFLLSAGRVLMMLGKVQFELQKFVDTYVSY